MAVHCPDVLGLRLPDALGVALRFGKLALAVLKHIFSDVQCCSCLRNIAARIAVLVGFACSGKLPPCIVDTAAAGGDPRPAGLHLLLCFVALLSEVFRFGFDFPKTS